MLGDQERAESICIMVGHHWRFNGCYWWCEQCLHVSFTDPDEEE